MHDLVSIPCVFHRGGTSRGLFFHERDLPGRERWDDIFLAAMGSPDVRQINGLGGATSHTSKVAVISPSGQSGMDVDYLFAQVGIDEPVVDYKGMCGNLLAAVGPFAVDEGLVDAVEPVTAVKVFNVNTSKRFIVHVPVCEGHSISQGDYSIYGVSGTGAKYRVDFLNPAGAYSGKLFPTGRAVDTIEIKDYGSLEVTILDVANPMVFIRAKDLGIENLAGEDPRKADAKRLALLEKLRCLACHRAGFIDDPQKASEKLPAVPRLALIQPPCDAQTLDGRKLKKEDMDLYSHMLSMKKIHQSYAATGAVCLAVAACVPGTVVGSVLTGSRDEKDSKIKSSTIRFGHPSGLMEVEVEGGEDGELKRVSMARTARRLMDGRVYVPASLFK
ncbi:MAG: 3-methylitaconate isomerase [Deltaproteobacteria bacterium]|nr:3-methylitaconate isomerase [Deltaproteobacteria bacterium]